MGREIMSNLVYRENNRTMSENLGVWVTDFPNGRLVSELPSGRAVRELQNYLKVAGFRPGLIDGVMGARTLSAFADFKDALYLADHHLIGPASYRALVQEALERGETQTAPTKAPEADKPSLDKKYTGGKMVSFLGR